jgi:CubicO group peptidase (beta-lactamase class C family)
VVDLWGGSCDAGRTRGWARDTLAMPYSVSKPFAAICALVLADRGLVDLDAPVRTYWPQMEADTTMRQVLSHQSGHVLLDNPAPVEAFYDWDLMCGLVAKQQPLWQPGSACGEAALLYGHLVGEVVRRVDGRSLGTFLREEVCGPHGLDFHVGLAPSDLARVADLTGLVGAEPRLAGRSPMLARAIGNPPGVLDPRIVNAAPWRLAEIPAVNGHGTARGVAGLFAALVSGQVLSSDMFGQLCAVAASGVDRVLGEEVQWGLGVRLDEDGFGMGGTGGNLGWYSTAGGYAIGFVTGLVADHDRVTLIENAVRGCLGLPSL